MLKWVWRFYSHKHSLWAHVIHGENGGVNKVVSGSNSCWRNIVKKVLALQDQGINFFLVSEAKLKVGDGSSIIFWEDNWMAGGGALKDRFPLVYALETCKQCVPIKINVFAWKVKMDGLPTRFNISRRGMNIDSMLCSLCDNGVESSNHMFFSCSLVRHLYRMISAWWDVPFKDVHSYVEWLEWLVTMRLSSKLKDILEGKFSENSFEVLKLLENSMEVLKIMKNKLESMKILENKLESLKLQENQPVDELIPFFIKKFTSDSVLARVFGGSIWWEYLAGVLGESTWREFLAGVLGGSSWR
nr:RNA-directed DNA polymerase, eukaryota [Tanacetum cinerariifolium]